ncbi:hypothetical protein [Tumebacillus flagellatus]|uniref:CRISPR-associated protein n=1 Tax=Tumebacillus flagellatus TaxID=1157490 RepID=A0A074LR13_9BACL|nr:hypothetical protein [Tumebacillus flagellatus]KEO83529.1 hypothetical protein EL26_08930 [Tumebacillus flagellatus]
MATSWILPKWSGTYADSLAAVGLAVLIGRLVGDDQKVRILEENDSFRVTGPELNIEQVDFVGLQSRPAFQYARLKDDTEDPDCPDTGYLDYPQQKRLYEIWRERNKQSKAANDLLDENPEQVTGYNRRFPHIQRINMLQGFGARNKLYLDITKADGDAFRNTVIERLKLLESGQARTTAKTPFQPSVSDLQVFNPMVGKGVNRLKADSASRGSLPGGYVDWFDEWLRFIGSEHVLNGFSVGDDIKMSVPVPADISIDKLQEMALENLTAAWHSRKVDLFVVMDQVAFLLKMSGKNRVDPWIPFGKRPNEIISAVQTGYFKSLGSGKAVTNISSLGLPGWFPVETDDDVELWRELLHEHRRVLQLLDEEKSEEAALLNLYRDFLSAGDWRAFLEFLGAYGCLVMRRRERGRPIRSFTINHLEGLLMKGNEEQKRLPIAEVIRNEGFRNVAAAMKQATVSEQFHKSKGNQVFDIKYGLFQEIKRKARFPEQLVAVVSEFVSEYNFENARRSEQLKDRQGRRRKNVSLDDLDKLNQLFIEHHRYSETIAMLLIAYASASSGEKSDSQENEEE